MVPKFIVENKELIRKDSDPFTSDEVSKYLGEPFIQFEVVKKLKNSLNGDNMTISKEKVIGLMQDRDSRYLGVVSALVWGGINAQRASDKKTLFTINC